MAGGRGVGFKCDGVMDGVDVWIVVVSVVGIVVKTVVGSC